MTARCDTVVLCWDRASRTNYNQPGYTFEGYNVYQGASVSGPWTRIATWDEVNGVRVIFDQVFDIATGQLIPQFPVAFGSDAGVRFCQTITQDAIRGGSLRQGTDYYFAVTAYSYGPTQFPKVLENAQQVVHVTTQCPALGTNLGTAATSNVTYTRTDTTQAPSTDVVTATVVTPSATTNSCYKIVFLPLPTPVTRIIGTDTVTVDLGWNLINTTSGDTLLKNQINKLADEDFAVVEGIQVRVNGPYSPALANAAYINANTDHRRALEGVNAGLPFFGGGAGYGWDFFGGTLDPANANNFTTVEFRFGQTQKAYRFLRLEQADGTAPSIGRAYLYAGFHDVNFQLWDIINNRQLDAAFVERAITDAVGNLLPTQPATHDSTWGPDDSALGGREYLFAMGQAYTGSPNPATTHDGALTDDSQPLMYALWSKLRDASDVIDPGDLFTFVFAKPATTNDVYTFCSSQLQRGNMALAGQGLDRIRAVPNPYYAHSRYELSQFNRVLRFINMPENATVRIFNLAGNLVRTLRKSDPTTSTLDWDLLTENRLPVGSGIYIYHVDAPGAGSTFGRLVVFMERERLNNF